jgi:hypothetical protein
MLRNTNKHFWRRCWGMVDVVVFKPNLPVYPFLYRFFSFILFVTMEPISIQKLSTPNDEFLQPSQSSKPITASGYELCPGFIAMAWEQTFSGFDDENPYHHMREFE